MYAASEALDFEKAARLRDDLGALEQGAGEAGGRARRRHRRRRDRARRGPARGRRPDLLRPRRPDPRPARLGRRPGRGGRHRRAGRGLPPPALRRRRGRRRRSRARSWCRRCRPTPTTFEAAAHRAAGEPGRGSGCRSAATRGPCRRPSPATPARRWCCTRPSAASDLTARNQALEEIQQALGLDEAPLRIECYDISNLQGTEVVASMVVFEDGLARKSEYRRFVITGASTGQNDVAVDARGDHPALPAAARRAGPVHRGRRPRPARCWSTPRPAGRASSPTRPGLVVVDGGPPQVAAAQRGARRARHRRHPGLRPGQAARGGLAARPGGPGDPAALQRGPLPPPAGPRRGPPVRDHPPPRRGGPSRWSRACSTTSPGSGRCAARRCSSTSARCRSCGPPRSTRSPRCPGIGPRTAIGHQGCGGRSASGKTVVREHRHRRDLERGADVASRPHVLRARATAPASSSSSPA